MRSRVRSLVRSLQRAVVGRAAANEGGKEEEERRRKEEEGRREEGRKKEEEGRKKKEERRGNRNKIKMIRRGSFRGQGRAYCGGGMSRMRRRILWRGGKYVGGR